MQEAVCHLLEGSLPKAQATMVSLQQKKYDPQEPNARLQAEFFQKVAALVIDPQPIPSPALVNFNRASFGSFALLIAGLKDWELGDFDSANTILRNFQGSTPTGEFGWIAEYHPLVEDYLSDLSAFRGATMIAKSARTQTELKDAATNLQKAKAGLVRGATRLGPKLDSAAQELLARVNTAPPDAKSLEAKDRTTSAEVRMKVVDLCKQWNFKEALAALHDVKILLPDLERDQRILIRKMEWLEQFKEQLIKDLAKGYNAPFKLADNTPRNGPITKATEGGVDFGAPTTESKSGPSWRPRAYARWPSRSLHPISSPRPPVSGAGSLASMRSMAGSRRSRAIACSFPSKEARSTPTPSAC